MVRDVKWVDGLPVCQRPDPEQEECDDCYGLGFLYIVDGADTPVCMGAVRVDRALLVEIAKAVYGPDFDQPYDEPRALAGLLDAVRAGWAEKERLRGVAERLERFVADATGVLKLANDLAISFIKDESIDAGTEQEVVDAWWEKTETAARAVIGGVGALTAGQNVPATGCHCDGGCGCRGGAR